MLLKTRLLYMWPSNNMHICLRWLSSSSKKLLCITRSVLTWLSSLCFDAEEIQSEVCAHVLESTLTYTFFSPYCIFRFVLLFRSLDFRPICCTCVRLSSVLIFLSLWLSSSLSLSSSPRFLECPCLTSQFLFVSSSGPGCPSLYKYLRFSFNKWVQFSLN